jgi:P27 family predicted phage terminase small subunit
MRGRKPIPTKIHILKGNPGQRRLNDKEPKPVECIPRCPTELDDIAKKEWKRITKVLYDCGLVTEIDRPGLASFCQVYSRWIQAEQKIQQEGMIIDSPNGYPILSPYLGIANRAIDQMGKALTEFGMTPAARSRIKVEPKATVNEFDDFLNAKKA